MALVLDTNAMSTTALHELVAHECGEGVLEEVDAQEIVCRDARAIVDFLDAEIGKPEVHPWERSLYPEELDDDDAFSTGRLLTILFDAGQPGLTQLTALRRLRDLFLEQMSDRVAELVAESQS